MKMYNVITNRLLVIIYTSLLNKGFKYNISNKLLLFSIKIIIKSTKVKAHISFNNNFDFMLLIMLPKYKNRIIILPIKEIKISKEIAIFSKIYVFTFCDLVHVHAI